MFQSVKKFFVTSLTLVFLVTSFAFVASAAQDTKHSPKHPNHKQVVKKPVAKKPVKKPVTKTPVKKK